MGAQYPRKPSHQQLSASGVSNHRPSTPCELSDNETDLVAQRKERLLTLLPDALPFFRSLYEEGLIDGWRSVTMVYELHPDSENSIDDAPPAGAVTDSDD